MRDQEENVSQYQIETTSPDGKPIIVPIPDGFIDQIRQIERMKVAVEISEYADALRAEDWGKSNRTKVSWLRAIAAVRKNVVLKGVDLKKVP